MTDRNGSEADHPQPAAKGSSRDGLIDFTHYSAEQLRELQHTIDRAAYPLNFDNLLLELERRAKQDEGLRDPPREFAVRFTPRDGLRGWVQAKLRWSSLYGAGSIELRSAEIALHGWQRTWLGTAVQTTRVVATETIRNVATSGAWFRFVSKQRRRLTKRFEFEIQDAGQAQALVAQLPDTRSAGFAKQWLELREFNERLRAASPQTWVTTAIVLANVAVYGAMAIAEKRLPGEFDMPRLLAWGANFGPSTVNGQWWRLFTALFLHANLPHLLFNMWALWNAGRLTERLYGKWPYLALYFLSGAFASLSSLVWNPGVASVGASGAIFGVLGAFLAFLANRATRTPAALVRAHWVSTFAFVLFNLVSGALQPGIDNAAHVGGLLAGFLFGWILARPIDVETRRSFPLKKGLVALAAAVACTLAALWQVRGLGAQLTIPEQYFRAHAWYPGGESSSLRHWQDLGVGVSNGTISDAEFAARFERDVLPFWKMAYERLSKEAPSVPAEQRAYAALVADFVRSRLDWSQALVDATRDQDEARGRDAIRLAEQTTLIQARLERALLRANMDHRPRALVNSAPVVKLRTLFSTNKWKCVRRSYWHEAAVAATDSRSDGPAARDAAACEAQRLFMAGEYRALDALMKRAAATRNDLPDGSSTLQALYGGLSTLLDERSVQIEEALARTSDWRRAMRGSLEPELVEASFFEDWAWQARGQGTQSTVSRLGWAAFAYRTEMAAEGLREVESRAQGNPVWYKLSLDVGLDQSLEVEKLRAVFDRGRERFPDYWPLYGSMLRILMPRWRGSREKVDEFVKEVAGTANNGSRYETYARLYWTYASLEGDEKDIFTDGLAQWQEMKYGFADLLRRHPKSDYVLNAFAVFACRSGDAMEYRRLRPQLDRRLSATAWPDKLSLKGCDAKFSQVTAQRPADKDTRKDAFYEAARAYDVKDWEAMRAVGQKLIDADPTAAEGYMITGAAEASAHRYPEAKLAYRKALALSPRDVRTWLDLGDVEMRTQDFPAALDALNHAIKVDPKAWRAWSDRAVVRDALGQHTEALVDARTACRNGYRFACDLVREWEP